MKRPCCIFESEFTSFQFTSTRGPYQRGRVNFTSASLYQKLTYADRVRHIQNVLDQHKKLTLELELAEVKALDEDLAEEERLSWAQAATAAADALNSLLKITLDDPVEIPTKLEAMLDDVASQGTASSRKSVGDYLLSKIPPEEQEDFMSQLDALHYDGSWDDGGMHCQCTVSGPTLRFRQFGNKQ